MKQYPAAFDAYRQVLRLEPNNADPYTYIAVTYVEMGHYEQAARAYEETVKLAPTDSSLRYELGLAYLKAGNRQRAIEVYNYLKVSKDSYAKDYATKRCAGLNLPVNARRNSASFFFSCPRVKAANSRSIRLAFAQSGATSTAPKRLTHWTPPALT